jgi:RNA-directed DNA polymerase
MIEKVIDRRNLRLAAQHVKANKGSAGVDGIVVTEISGYLKTHRDKLCSDLVLGKYRSQPILGVEIPKSNGKTRLLGIPTVIDLKNFFDEVDHCKLMQLL